MAVVCHCIQVFPMELIEKPCAIAFLPTDIIQTKLMQPSITLHLDLQSRGRFKRTCKKYYAECDVDTICPRFDKDSCMTHVCQVLASNYNACTKALVHCAKTGNDEMFNHLFYYHGFVRNDDLLFDDSSFPTFDECMGIYRNYYGKQKNIRKRRFTYLLSALSYQDSSAAKTVLLGDDFDVVHAAYNYKKKYLINAIFNNACHFNDVDLLQALLGGISEKNRVKVIEFMVMHSAANIISQLIMRKVLKVDAVGTRGRTMLHYASIHDNAALIRVLLKHGAYINGVDSLGYTPLHCASRKLSVNSVAELLQADDADVRITDNAKKTALDYVSNSKSFALTTAWERSQRKQIKLLLKSHVLRNFTDHATPIKKTKGNSYSILD